MVLIDGDGTIVLMNNQTEHLFGYRREDLQWAAGWWKFWSRSASATAILDTGGLKFFAEIKAAFALMDIGAWISGACAPTWHRIPDRELSLSPDRQPAEGPDRSGRPSATMTVQKAASGYARELIEASLDPLVTISAEGKITDVNEATIKITGVPRESLIGTDFSDYFTEPAENWRARVIGRSSPIGASSPITR